MFLFLSFSAEKERKENRKREERRQGGSNVRPLGTPAAALTYGADLAWKRPKLPGTHLAATANLPRLRTRRGIAPLGGTKGPQGAQRPLWPTRAVFAQNLVARVAARLQCSGGGGVTAGLANPLKILSIRGFLHGKH